MFRLDKRHCFASRVLPNFFLARLTKMLPSQTFGNGLDCVPQGCRVVIYAEFLILEQQAANCSIKCMDIYIYIYIHITYLDKKKYIYKHLLRHGFKLVVKNALSLLPLLWFLWVVSAVERQDSRIQKSKQGVQAHNFSRIPALLRPEMYEKLNSFPTRSRARRSACAQLALSSRAGFSSSTDCTVCEMCWTLNELDRPPGTCQAWSRNRLWDWKRERNTPSFVVHKQLVKVPVLECLSLPVSYFRSHKEEAFVVDDINL